MKPHALQSAANGIFLGVNIVPTSPALARAMQEQVSAHSLGILMVNSVVAQRHQFTLFGAVAGVGAKKIYSLNSTADAVSVLKISE